MHQAVLAQANAQRNARSSNARRPSVGADLPPPATTGTSEPVQPFSATGFAGVAAFAHTAHTSSLPGLVMGVKYRKDTGGETKEDHGDGIFDRQASRTSDATPKGGHTTSSSSSAAAPAASGLSEPDEDADDDGYASGLFTPSAGSTFGFTAEDMAHAGDGDSRMKLAAAAAAVFNNTMPPPDGSPSTDGNRSLHDMLRAIHGRRASHADLDYPAEFGTLPFGILSPSGTFRQIWDTITLVLVFINAICTPFWIGFGLDESATWWGYVENSIDLWFTVDILLRFRTAFLDDGELVTDWKRIAKHYAVTWLLLDVASTFPFGQVLDDILETSTSVYAELPSMLRIIRLTRLMKVLRVLRIPTNRNALPELGVVSRTILRLASHMMAVLLMVHIAGCLWGAVYLFEQDVQDETWASYYSVDTTSTFAMYTACVYYAMTTLATVGYGDISARTVPERIFAVFLLMIGTMMFAMLMGKASSIAASVGQRAMEQQRMWDSVNEFCMRERLPKELRGRIRRYYALTMQDFQGDQEDDEVIRGLSPALRREVLLFMNRKMVDTVPFFRNAEAGFLSLIITRFTRLQCMPGEYVVIFGELSREFFVLQSGEVEVVSEYGNILKILADGSFFGEIGVLENTRRTASVRARRLCHMYSIGGKELTDALAHYPEFAEGLRCVARARRMFKLPKTDKKIQVPPPTGFTSWDDVRHKDGAFKDKAVLLASALVADETPQTSTWQRLKSNKQFSTQVMARRIARKLWQSRDETTSLNASADLSGVDTSLQKLTSMLESIDERLRRIESK